MPFPIVHHNESITVRTFLALFSHKQSMHLCTVLSSQNLLQQHGWVKNVQERMREGRQHLHITLFSYFSMPQTISSYYVSMTLKTCHMRFLKTCIELGVLISKMSALGASWVQLTFATDKTICRSNVMCQLGDKTVFGKEAVV